jgi:hypothetical protein
MTGFALVLAASGLTSTVAFAEGAAAPVVADAGANGAVSLAELQATRAAVTDASGELSPEEVLLRLNVRQ